MDAASSDPTGRSFDAGESLDNLEKTPEGSDADLTDRCSVCEAGIPAGSGFCRRCGTRTSEPSANYGGSNGAEREGLQQLDALRDSAIGLESESRYREAELLWHRVLDIQPEHRQAVAAIERLRGRVLDERFVEMAGEFQAAIEERGLSQATRLLHKLRTIDAPAGASQLPQCEQALETLRRTLLLELEEAFDAAVKHRRCKTARAVISRLSELGVDPAEVSAKLERLRSRQRAWRRRRTARRLVACVLLLMLAATGYLMVADQHNRQIAGDAAAALARGDEPQLTGFLPSWPADDRTILAARSTLCRTLDGRYGSDDWRRTVQDVELFGSRRDGSDLVAEFNWLILREIAGAALAGSDGDLNRARDLVGRIAWRELGPRGEPFRQRQDALREILGGWYDGPLSLQVFADSHLVGEPKLGFVSEQAAHITDPETDCETIARLARLLVRLGQGEHIPDQVRAHNQRVVEAIGNAVDDPRSNRIANLLNHLCVETGDPDRAAREVRRALERLVDDLRRRAEAGTAPRANVIALLVAIDRGAADPPAEVGASVELLVREQAGELLPTIEHAFETSGDVGTLLDRLRDQSVYWSYLGDAAGGLRERERRLRELHERWSGGPLRVAPLCEVDRGEEVNQLWLEFERATEAQALDAFHKENAQHAARLAELLRAFDYETEPLRDLAKRIRIHEGIPGLVEVLPEPAYEELRRRLFMRHPPDRRTTPALATDIVLAAIESGALDTALGLAPIADAPELAAIARNLRQLADLPAATLRELEASVLSDVRLPTTSRMIRGEVERRLELCLPSSTTLKSPGQLSLGAAHEVIRVSVQPQVDAGLDLEPLVSGGDVYRVPFLETGPVTVTLWDAFGITTSRRFDVVHSRLRNPAEVTLRTTRVVEGEPAVVAIRPRLAFDRVTVEGVDRTDELADRGDHWVLEVATSLEPGQPAATRQWSMRLLTREGVQNLELPLTVVAPAIVEAERALHLGKYERVFDLLDEFARRDHDTLRHLVHEAGARWVEQIRASDLDSRAEADALVNECGRFLAKVPDALHQDAAAIRDRAWVRRIETTATWDSVDALLRDLAFLQGLEETGELQRKMIAWLTGAANWAEPIVDHMERRPGDWSTVHDRINGTSPAALVHRRTGLEFVYVPTGSFGIGGHSKAPNARPHRYVTIRGFFVSRTECTRAAWAAGRHDTPPPVWAELLPVTGVPFVEAAAWCRAQGLDLPTEAQWELAAAGVVAREYPWGDDECQPNVKRAFRSSELAEVGSVFDCDRSPYGVMDMAGNVREWCYPVSNATYRILPDGAQDPSPWLDGIVVRGASWQDPLRYGRTHHREFVPGSPTEVGPADPAVGFRPVLNRD